MLSQEQMNLVQLIVAKVDKSHKLEDYATKGQAIEAFIRKVQHEADKNHLPHVGFDEVWSANKPYREYVDLKMQSVVVAN